MLARRKHSSLTGLVACAVLLCAPGVGAAASPSPEGSQAGQGKTPDYEVYELGEMQVHGQRESAAKDVIMTKTLDAEEIEASGAHAMPEALRMLPGLNVTSTGRKNAGSAPFVGFNREQTQFLIDGVPYYEPYQNDTNLNAFPTDIVGRIDVMRGAPSVLYGAGGMGGIINLITKQATDKPTFSAYSELGDYETWNIGATHGNRVGDIRYWVSGRYQTSDGWRLSDSYDPVMGSYGRGKDARDAILQGDGRRENADSESASLWGKAGYEPDENSAYYVTGFYSHNNWGDPWSIHQVPQYFPQDKASGSGAFTAFDRISRYDDWGVDFDAKQRLASSLVGRLKLFYHGHQDDYESYAFNPVTRTLQYTDGQDWYNDLSTYKDWTLGGSALLDWAIHEKDSLRFALHYKKDDHQQRDARWLDFSEASAFTGSSAIENEWRPVDGLSIVAGVAYNWYEMDAVDESLKTPGKRHPWHGTVATFDDPGTMDSVDPMIGASYTFTDATRLFGSVARRSRFPSLKELYGSLVGNPNLDPERSINCTLGVERPFFDDTLTLSLAGFYNQIEDRIDGDLGAGRPNENYGEIHIYGFETAAAWTPVAGLTLRLGYTFAEGENHDELRVTDEVTDTPQHKLTASLAYTVPEIATRLDLNAMFVSDQYSWVPTPSSPSDPAERISGYSLVNLRISQPIREHLEVYAQAYNLLDANYEEQYGYPGRGRSFLVGMKTNF